MAIKGDHFIFVPFVFVVAQRFLEWRLLVRIAHTARFRNHLNSNFLFVHIVLLVHPVLRHYNREQFVMSPKLDVFPKYSRTCLSRQSTNPACRVLTTACTRFLYRGKSTRLERKYVKWVHTVRCSATVDRFSIANALLQ